MWLSHSVYERLLTQAAQSVFLAKALASAEKRADAAEDALVAERSAKDWLTLQLSSRVVTKHGGHGLDYEKPVVESVKSPHPKGWIRDPDDEDIAKLEWYKQKCREAGHSDDEAEAYWEAEMRGERPSLLGTMDSESEQ